MAIQYTYTPIAESTAVAAGLAWQNAFRTALLGHSSGAYTLIEEFDSSPAGMRWTVVKCSNGGDLSGDFYLCFGRRTSDGAVAAFLAEAYSSATKTASKFAPFPMYSGTVYIRPDFTLGANASTDASFVLSSTHPSGAAGTPCYFGVIPGASAKATFCIDSNSVFILLDTTAHYFGGIESTITPSNLWMLPLLVSVKINTNSNTQSGITRHPFPASMAGTAVSGGSTFAYPYGLVSPTSSWDLSIENYAAVVAGVYDRPDRLQNNRVAASRLFANLSLTASTPNPASENYRGTQIGRFKGIRFTSGPKAGVHHDTISVDGRKHVIFNTSGSAALPSNANFMHVADTGEAV